MTERIKILYVDDYDLDRELVKDSLEREHGGFEVVETSNKAEFVAALQSQDFDAVLSDFNIAGFDGLEVIDIVRQKDIKIPVIIVTGTGSEEIAVKAMLQGASDYVIKRPHHIRRLPFTLLAAIERYNLKEKQKNDNRVLLESENRLRNLIQQIPVALLVYNSEFGIIESNSEAQRLLGMNSEQLKGRKASSPVWSLLGVDGEVLSIEDYPIYQAFAEKKPIQNRIVGLTGQEKGETTWLMINVVPEFEGFDSRTNIIVSFVDITEQRKTQEALRNSEERLQLAQDASNDGLWDWNVQSGEVYFNPRYFTMLGYLPYEMSPSYETWSSLLHPEEREHVEETILAHLHDRHDAFELEFRLRQKSGDWRWILGKGKVFLRDKDGKPIRAIGTHTDIDHLKKVQAELFQSREKYLSLFNNVELGISILSPQLKTLEANSRMKKWFPRITGASQSCCYHLIPDPPRKEPCTDCPVLKTLNDGLIHEGSRETTVNGKTTIFRSLSSPIHDKQGNVVSVIRILEDVTERKRLEKQVRQSQKMESLGTMAGGISHDFNNILTAILGFAELAIDEVEEGSALEEDLNEILTAGTRAKNLVAQILAFSRKTEQDYQPVTISPIIKESLKLMKSILPASIEIRSDLSVDSETVLSDPTQLHQILVNLCTNSAHAMEEKGGVLEISLRNDFFGESIMNRFPGFEPGDYLCLTVCDSGQGIPPDILERIFEPYFTTKEEGKGSGLGLSVVHGLVKMHGGHITADSEVGKGTSIHVYLPLVKQQTEAAGMKHEQHLPKGTAQILLIDDELQILKMQKQSLEKLGYTVTTSSKSHEALQIFRDNPQAFDLVLTDMTMPKMSGDELVYELKKIRQGIPVILCTGFSVKISMTDDSELPIDAYLMKPIDRKEMAQTIRSVLDKAKG